MLPAPPRFTLFPYTTLFRSSFSAAIAAFGSPLNNSASARAHAGSGLDFIMFWGNKKSDHPIPHKLRLLFVLVHDADLDRKSTRLNSSHVKISYAVFCLKKKI